MRGKIILDIGNTRTKWCELEQYETQNSYFSHPTLDLFELFESWKSKNFDTVIVSNVSFHSIEQIKLALPEKNIIEITGNTPSTLSMAYQTPQTLGPDRYLAAIGAQAEFPNQAILVVDFGTCIKYECISDNAQYLGGAISPGIEMRFKAMHTFTGKLPLMENQIPRLTIPEFGVNTNESLYVGVFQGIVGELKQFIHQMEVKNEKLCIIFSGGYAQEFANYLENHIFVRPNLVLTGLVQIIRHNRY